jgi:hypothetical protein
MSARPRSGAVLAAALAAAVLAGCSNPDARGSSPVLGSEAPSGSPGEPPAPAASTGAGSEPLQAKRTPEGAIASFAALYFNWDYRNLAEHQRTLAAVSVGAARLAESQAAASSSADSTISAGQITNSGTVQTLARERGHPAVWVIVTREQTRGSGGYEGLPSSFHVTLARVASVHGGYAVSEWLPQD